MATALCLARWRCRFSITASWRGSRCSTPRVTAPTIAPTRSRLLGWAAHQIGLDLQAMRANELEAEVAGLNAQLSAMAGERDRLSAMLTASPLGRAEGA
jgi:hypothetical protein